MRLRDHQSTVLAAVLTLTLSAGYGFAQQGRGGTGGTTGSGSTGSTGSTGTTGTTGGTTGTTGTTGTSRGSTLPSTGASTTQPNIPRPFFISGKVVTADGSALPSTVVIERQCGPMRRQEGYTDMKGRFSVELGANNAVIPDASFSSGEMGRNNLGTPLGGSSNVQDQERALWGCEIRATLAGYRSTAVSLAGRRFMDNPDIGTIVLTRMGDVEGLTVSGTSSMASKDARKAFEKGESNFKKGKTEAALKDLQKAVELYPKYAVAWYTLGQAYEKQDKYDDARKAYDEAIGADPKYVNPYTGLYILGVREKKWDEVAQTTEKVIQLNRYDFPQAYYFNGVANLNLGKLDVAEKSIREMMTQGADKQFPRSSWLLGVVLAQKHDYAGAAEQFRNYLKVDPNSSDAETVRNQLMEVEKVAQTPVKK